MCIGGVPSVFYGDEQGLRGRKEDRAGGDDAVRPAFPASPADLLPDGWRYYRLHQRLIGFRRRHPWLVRARTEAAQLEQSALALRVRGERAGEQALLLLNVGDTEFRFAVETAGLTVAETADVTGAGAAVADPLLVPPHSWTILA
jgi:glycosidase